MKSIALAVILTLAIVPVAAQQVTAGPGSIVQSGNDNQATLGGGPSVTQTPDDTKAVTTAEPTLNNEQKLAIQNMALTLENLQLKAQQVAAEHQKIQAQMQQMITTLTPAGYQLTADPEKGLVFVKIPPPAAKKD